MITQTDIVFPAHFASDDVSENGEGYQTHRRIEADGTVRSVARRFEKRCSVAYEIDVRHVDLASHLQQYLDNPEHWRPVSAGSWEDAVADARKAVAGI